MPQKLSISPGRLNLCVCPLDFSLEPGGIKAFIRRQVLPHTEDAWFDEGSIKIGYEISFNRYFSHTQSLWSLEGIRKDTLPLEKETEGLLVKIVGGGA